MKEKIDLKILWAELCGKIREFYPYFLGFYLLSLIMSVFSKTWRSFFYWPAFHGAIIIFSVFFLFSVKIKLNFYKPNFNKLNFKLNLREKNLSWRGSVLELAKQGAVLVGRVLKLLTILAGNFFQTIRRLAMNLLVFIKKKFFEIFKRSWLKIIIVVTILLLALFKGIGVLDFIILFYALVSFFFVLDSRIAAGMALISLAACPGLLILKKEALAEAIAIYAYYFLAITVLTQIREMVREKKAESTQQ
jgi:hypothetical protein